MNFLKLSQKKLQNGIRCSIRSILLSSLAILFFQETASALSCVPTVPTVAKVKSIKKLKADSNNPISRLELDLEQEVKYEQSQESQRDISFLKKAAKDYLAGQLTSPVPEMVLSMRAGQPLILEKSDSLDIKVGDLIVRGGPIYVCNHALTAFFSPQGNLKYILVKDAFNPYKLESGTLKVAPGSETECQMYTCEVEVEFLLNSFSYVLVPGESHEVSGDAVKKITLLESKNQKKPAPGATPPPVIADWGMGTRAYYLLTY